MAAPASGDLTARDADPKLAASRRRLARALKGVTNQFDLVVIDCAPSLGLNTVNGLAAAKGALLVVEPSIFGLRGVAPVLDLIEDVWSADNPSLDLAGVVLNRVPAVSSAARERIDELKKMVGSKSVWSPYVPQRVVINQAHHERAPSTRSAPRPGTSPRSSTACSARSAGPSPDRIAPGGVLVLPVSPG